MLKKKGCYVVKKSMRNYS